MSTEKEPDYKGIAERLAENAYVDTWREGRERRAYASCMEARLRSDWETIRLLKELDTIAHVGGCRGDEWTDDRPGRNGKMPTRYPCTCGLSAHLSKLLEPFTPTNQDEQLPEGIDQQG
jgi:hypothetical protein